MVKTTLVYDFDSCGRCGGTGSYSYCSMYGSTCFQCRGQKRCATKAGHQAFTAVQAFIAAHYSVPVRALVPGDVIKYDGCTRRVVACTFDGHYGSVNGVRHEQWTLTLNKPIRSPFGSYASIGLSGDATVVKAPTGADWDAVVAFARTLKKGVTVVETPVAAQAVR